MNYKRIIVVFSPKSTRANAYKRIRPLLVDYQMRYQVGFKEVRLVDTPYFEGRDLISSELKDGDLVLACGGDGTAQVTFDAVYCSGVDATFATVPLGNSNDLSVALNGNHRNPKLIMTQPAREINPINIYINGKRQFALASYITFGATTVLVDYLNNAASRQRRRQFRALSPALSLPLTKLGEISRCINELEFTDFERDGKMWRDDSIGFFAINAAHNILRLPKNILTADSEFFFHHALTKGRNLAGKIIMAGAWAVRFPGEFTNLEKLVLTEATDLVANVAGDNIALSAVKNIAAVRSERSVKVLLH